MYSELDLFLKKKKILKLKSFFIFKIKNCDIIYNLYNKKAYLFI